jgi:hypothetical protein
MIEMRTNTTPFIFLSPEAQEYIRKVWSDIDFCVTFLDPSGTWVNPHHVSAAPKSGVVYRVTRSPVAGEKSVLVCEGYRVVVPTLDGVPVVETYCDVSGKHCVRIERNRGR